jgi:hypothetical protein
MNPIVFSDFCEAVVCGVMEFSGVISRMEVKTLSNQQLAAALDSISESVGKADSAFDAMFDVQEQWERQQKADSAASYVELAYVKLQCLCEVLELPLLRNDVSKSMVVAGENGFIATDTHPGGDSYLLAPRSIMKHVFALRSIFLTEPSQTITKDLETILRAMTYSIVDRNAFGEAPFNEEEVHHRVEAVLRCIFPDLLHKPRITKQIKHFEPDTGIPSIRTLIEYKFVNDENDCKRVADEILADTRGYASPDWQGLIFVFYETRPLRSEVQWRQMLRTCDVAAELSSVVVLTGGSSVGVGQGGKRRP